MGKKRKHTLAAERQKRFNQNVRCKPFVQSREESFQVAETCTKEVVDTSEAAVHASESTANCDGNVLPASCVFQTSDACICLGEDKDVV